MILLDTDHISVLEVPSSERRSRWLARLSLVTDQVIGTTIVTVEEQMRGWLAAIHKERQPRRLVRPYRELGALFAFFGEFEILPFTDEAAKFVEQFGRIQIGTKDKRIAAIALANNALLLTANRRDYEHVPGLRFENWMDPPPVA
jgi:tRNA(fMet)-specific endonuclease VapC